MPTTSLIPWRVMRLVQDVSGDRLFSPHNAIALSLLQHKEAIALHWYCGAYMVSLEQASLIRQTLCSGLYEIDEPAKWRRQFSEELTC